MGVWVQHGGYHLFIFQFLCFTFSLITTENIRIKYFGKNYLQQEWTCKSKGTRQKCKLKVKEQGRNINTKKNCRTVGKWQKRKTRRLHCICCMTHFIILNVYATVIVFLSFFSTMFLRQVYSFCFSSLFCSFNIYRCICICI